jgi:CelD/BcsL family acetyltransferase involved in cellulose biosynthesis
MDQCSKNTPLKLQLLDYEGALSELRPSWQQLHTECEAVPFLRWSWLALWWDIYRQRGDRLHLLVVRDGARLVAVAPLYLQHSQNDCLRFLGTGESEYEEVCSEYLDLLIAPGYERDCLNLFRDYLLSPARRWTQMQFDRTLPGSLIERLIHRLDERCSVLMEHSGWRYRLSLPRSADDWLAMLSDSTRDKLRRSERKLSRAGGLRAERARTADDAERLLDELTRLHSARWAERGRAGVFAAPRFNAFHRQLTRQLIGQDSLNLALYRIDEQPAVGLYSLHGQRSTYYYQSGFDLRRFGSHSPLFVAHCREIFAAIARGDRYYDFMRSGERSAHKLRFGCAETPMYSYRVAPRGVASVGFGLRRAHRWLRRQSKLDAAT